MQIEFETTADDLATAASHLRSRTVADNAMLMRTWMFSGSFFAALVGMAVGAKITPNGSLWAAIVTAAFTIVFSWQMGTRRNTRRFYRQYYSESLGSHRGEKQSLRLSEEGIVSTSELIDYCLRWRAVDRIEVTAEHAIIHSRRMSMIPVPRRAFAAPEQFDAFVHLVESLMTAHGGGRSLGFPVKTLPNADLEPAIDMQKHEKE